MIDAVISLTSLIATPLADLSGVLSCTLQPLATLAEGAGDTPGLNAALMTLALLIGLELVLGVDNVLVIAILVGRLPEAMRNKARLIGLSLAMLLRLLMLFVVLQLAKLTQPILFSFSVRDLILLGGGLFLLWKAVKEIHHTVELKDEHDQLISRPVPSFSSIITQIIALDLVFSLDSVITAVGLTTQLWVIIASVVLSFLGVMLYARSVGEFIIRNPAIKVLALSFLVTIGITLCMESFGAHVPKGYIYLPMGFALGVELLQMRMSKNRDKMKAK
ncbi:MAG: TerC family protein [Verrucomicrobiota bacterium]|nr:TerC family protein [Verrucomicrobiota bacterium]